MSLEDSDDDFRPSNVKKIVKKSPNHKSSNGGGAMTDQGQPNDDDKSKDEPTNNNLHEAAAHNKQGEASSSSSHHQDGDDNNNNLNSHQQQHHSGKQVVTSEPEPGSPIVAADDDDDGQEEEGDGEEEEDSRVVIDPVQKQIFDEQREQIMGTVPDSIKGKFGEILYSTFGSYVGPVLILNPYHTPPGPVRDQWFRMYEKCKASGRLANMTHLVYWYGTYDNVDNAYSFMPTNKLIPFEQGKKRVDSKLETLWKKSRLKSTDELLQKGVLEMQEDLEKDPSERAGNIGLNFLEVYEHIIESGQEYVPDPNHVVLAATTPEPKKKKTGKRKHKDVEEATESNETDAAAPKAKKKKKKPKQKKPEASTADDDDGPSQASLPLKKRKKKKKQAAEAMEQSENTPVGEGQAAPPKEERRMSAYDEYMLAMAEERSHGDTDDEDLDIGGLASDDDAGDDKFLSDDKSDEMRSKPGRPKDSKSRIKDPPKKKGTKAKAKIAKRPKGEKKVPAMDAKRRAEQRRFEVCEEKYAPLIRRWKRALGNKDADQISRIYGELLGVVDKFSASFIQVNELSARMKESKKIVNNEQRKELLGKLKDQYSIKSQDVPAGFVPEIVSERSGSMTSKAEPKAQQKAATPQKVKAKKSLVESKSVKQSKRESDNDLSKPIANDGPSETEQLPSQQLNAKQPAVAKLDKKKKFSLGGLMRPPSVPLPEETDEKQASSTNQAEPAAGSQSKARTWMSRVSDAALQVTDENRLLALEFLRQAAPFVPLTKGVNHDAIAQNLEVAVFDWASSGNQQGDSSVANGSAKGAGILVGESGDRYWNKLHGLVAGISGKRKPGTIARMIGNGNFEEAADLVKLSVDSLYKSFQGKALPGF